jgi:hypothetical protein
LTTHIIGTYKAYNAQAKIDKITLINGKTLLLALVTVLTVVLLLALLTVVPVSVFCPRHKRCSFVTVIVHLFIDE